MYHLLKRWLVKTTVRSEVRVVILLMRGSQYLMILGLKVKYFSTCVISLVITRCGLVSESPYLLTRGSEYVIILGWKVKCFCPSLVRSCWHVHFLPLRTLFGYVSRAFAAFVPMTNGAHCLCLITVLLHTDTQRIINSTIPLVTNECVARATPVSRETFNTPPQ